MAARTTPAVGYSCKFETKPPDDIPTECPVCLLVLREPFQLMCCGNVFCKACIKEVLQNKSVCPTCKKEQPKCFRDKRLKQTLHGYRVTCNEGSGRSFCDWVGELGQLDAHLNLDPPSEKQLKGCRFAEIKCQFCHKLFQRRYLNNHQLKDCLKRPFKCKHCGHKDTHENGMTIHVPVCPKHPVPCPNCKHTYERQNLEHHVNEKCSLTLVPCDYHVVGCGAKPARQDMQDHIKKEMMAHVSLLQQHLKQHPQQSSDCLPLVASCLEQVMVNHREIHEKHAEKLENVELKWSRSATATEQQHKRDMEGMESRLKKNVDDFKLRYEAEMCKREWKRVEECRVTLYSEIVSWHDQRMERHEEISGLKTATVLLFIMTLGIIFWLCNYHNVKS